MLERLPATSKAEAVYRRLHAGIEDGTIAAGARLRQDELAARWGVSSTPVREAFRRLEAEGLVELLPHRGVVVRERPVDNRSLIDAAELAPGSDFP
ncbi:MAG TPA: GntR family transcriptional regulator [Dehalococcoidia bacterium]|nr:GntR family transcriptional regulator [Dehalococcoidia bacterium]